MKTADRRPQTADYRLHTIRPQNVDYKTEDRREQILKTTELQSDTDPCHIEVMTLWPRNRKCDVRIFIHKLQNFGKLTRSLRSLVLTRSFSKVLQRVYKNLYKALSML